MALVGAKGVALITCFLVVAGVIEYVIIRHIYSGQRKAPFFEWDNPRISDGFSKVEVENVEARYKRIKIFPAGVNSSSNRKDSGYWEKVDQGKQGDDVFLKVIDKKKEDYSYDYKGDFDEHGRPKERKNSRDQVGYAAEGVDGGSKVDKKTMGGAAGVFGTAAKALSAFSKLKEMVGGTFEGKQSREEEVKKKEEVVSGSQTLHNTMITSSSLKQTFVDSAQKSQSFNVHPMSVEPLVEYDNSRHPRPLSPFEAAGNNIMFTLRTTKPFHDKRLPLLFETWMRKANHSNIFIVTDGEDKKWLKKAWDANLHYVLTSCGKTYLRNELCCKAGIELDLIFQEGHEHYDWLCHIDDDIYVNVKQLVKFLSKFDPKKEAIYFGRSGSGWQTPRQVMKGALYGTPEQKYHFAVGGMYCLSRPMLELSKPYLIGGKNFAKSCSKTLEPEDVTVGVVVGVVLNRTLFRTEAIYTHGLHLSSTVDPYTLPKQIAFAYGFGAIKWGYEPYNAIYVPNALFSYPEDESQFRSLHCHLYPKEEMCLKKEHEKRKQQEERNKSVAQKLNNNPGTSR